MTNESLKASLGRSFPRDSRLRARAAAVIPGGMWGHQRAAAVPAGYPQFFSSGQGARIHDADGNAYIDFMCGWGPVVLGHGHAGVEAAAEAQAAKGRCLSGPTECAVELAELLVETLPHADWSLFQKNGADATTTCVTLARAATRRRKILVARGAYHGAVPWCSPSLAGVTAEDRAHVLHYDFNDLDSLDRAVAAAGEDLAAILVSAFRHDLARTQDQPTADFAAAARGHCDAAGAALILDDVRAGFRVHLGGSWEPLGVRPDLSAFSKAIANGHPLAAVTGRDWLREAAAEIFVTGSFWYAGPPMAAACATIRELQRLDGPARLRESGLRLREGLAEQALRHGFAIEQSGPPAMPMLLFADDPERELGAAFCREALKRGLYMHNRHNMFLSTAHSLAVIDEALAASDEAFAALARERQADARRPALSRRSG
ncbi:MAG: aminotransferase class III-fold pyridoxal phosphate-dependent enzyme [Rhodospirillales bacterium]